MCVLCFLAIESFFKKSNWEIPWSWLICSPFHTRTIVCVLPKRHRHYVLGPLSRVGSLYKGNSTSFEEPAGFPFDTGAVWLCANLNAKCAASQGKTKDKARNKFGGGLPGLHSDPHPRGEASGRLLLPLWVTAWLGGPGERLVPIGVLSAWWPLQKRDFWNRPFVPAGIHYDIPSRANYLHSYLSTLMTLPGALHDSCPFHVET